MAKKSAAKNAASEDTGPTEADLKWIAEPLRPLAVRVDSLVPDPENTVSHDEQSVERIAASLQEFGQDQPLVVQKDGRIVRKGNGRLAAAKLLKREYIAVVMVDEANVDAVRRSIADNRVSEFRKWDMKQVTEMLQRVREAGGEIEPVGWSTNDLEKMINKYGEQPDLVPSGAADTISGQEPEEVSFEQASGVRMAHLFLNAETFAEYTSITDTLKARYSTDNATDTVMAALREMLANHEARATEPEPV